MILDKILDDEIETYSKVNKNHDYHESLYYLESTYLDLLELYVTMKNESYTTDEDKNKALRNLDYFAHKIDHAYEFLITWGDAWNALEWNGVGKLVSILNNAGKVLNMLLIDIVGDDYTVKIKGNNNKYILNTKVNDLLYTMKYCLSWRYEDYRPYKF